VFHIILFEPEIPPNTGNIIRLCANTGCSLHLVEPLGFSLDDRSLRRAGLDYHEWASLCVYRNVSQLDELLQDKTLYTFSTHHSERYDRVSYPPGAALMFGPETRGLPPAVRNRAAPENRLTIPMAPNSRSLNLSNSVAVAMFEALRQNDFAYDTR